MIYSILHCKSNPLYLYCPVISIILNIIIAYFGERARMMVAPYVFYAERLHAHVQFAPLLGTAINLKRIFFFGREIRFLFNPSEVGGWNVSFIILVHIGYGNEMCKHFASSKFCLSTILLPNTFTEGYLKFLKLPDFYG